MKTTFLVYDNNSSVNDFPLGIGYLLSALKREGFESSDIDVYNMDVYHYSDDELYEYLKVNEFEVVCIGMIAGYWQYRQLKRMISVVNRLRKKPIVILGGYMFTPEPEFFVKKFNVDYIVLGEGETSFPELMKCLATSRPVKDISGLAFLESGKVVTTKRAKPIKDLDSIPFPAWDKFPIENYVTKVRIPVGRGQRSFPIISSRGCAYKCTFCYRMEEGYRMRSLDSVMEEAKILITNYHLNTICFRDELLMITPERAMGFAERIIKENIKINFDIDGRLNAVQPDVLKVLKKAGCVYINYGVESLDQNVLNNMDKKQTVEEILRGVKMTIDSGINPGLNVIFGSVGDTRETAKKVVNFLLKYNTYGELRTLKPVTPYPGSPLYYSAIERGLIKDCEDFYENKHFNSDLFACNFTELTDKELYDVIFEANQTLIRDHFTHISDRHVDAYRKLYFEGDIDFRGVRH